MAASGSILGNAVIRFEDPAILRGDARYFDDVVVPGQTHLVLVRSTVAHAHLLGIDADDARRCPGVLGVWTAADLDLPSSGGRGPIPAPMARPALAQGKVRFVGDIVAAVLAETRAQGVDAAEQVIVDYDPLPAVTDPELALEDGAPILFEDHGTNHVLTYDFGQDPDLLADAEVVVSGRFVNQRVAPVPMEPNGIAIEPDPTTGGFLAYVATQAPHGVRNGLAGALGLPTEQVRVIARTVGGGFGAKMGTYPEFVIAATLCKLLDRPVKWAEGRSESMTSLVHGRAQVQRASLGLRRDGTFTGLQGRLLADAGAYPSGVSYLTVLTRQMGQGVYAIPKVELNSIAAATNTTSVNAYRGAGRPEAAALLERLVDLAAVELDMDPVEIRRRNLLPPEAFPLTTVTGANYDVGEYEKALDEALRVSGYDELRAEQARRRAAGDPLLLGIGVAVYVEVTAGGLGKEDATIDVDTDGHVTVRVGTSAHGQGHETAFRMIVAELLGVSMDDVTILQADTGLVARGEGTMGSRSLQIGGSAVFGAADLLVGEARRLAAHLLEASPDDIVVTGDGGLGVAGVPARALSWGELASAALDPQRRPEGFDPRLGIDHVFDQGEASYPFGAHVAVVEVDAETGRTELVRHVAVDDCGRILNPVLVRGQQHGGIAQGAAQALWEQVVYDDEGNPLTSNLMDYAMPSAAELPSFEASNTETPTPLNPLGAKGIGESGTIGSTPAVQNAVVDALAHLGVRHVDMPCTPERVWRAIQGAKNMAGTQ